MDCRALKGMLELHIMLQCQHHTKLKINTLQCNIGAGLTSNLAKTTAFQIQTGASATNQAYENNTDGRYSRRLLDTVLRKTSGTKMFTVT